MSKQTKKQKAHGRDETAHSLDLQMNFKSGEELIREHQIRQLHSGKRQPDPNKRTTERSNKKGAPSTSEMYCVTQTEAGEDQAGVLSFVNEAWSHNGKIEEVPSSSESSRYQ